MMDQIQMTSEQQKQNEHMKMEQPKSILHAAEQMERPVEITKTESSILDRMNALPTECCVMEQQLQREVEEAGKLVAVPGTMVAGVTARVPCGFMKVVSSAASA